ncbi:hypothetical protein [Bifidobacterium saguinibicoloris]|uniref:hypothetical protein n=1 Tax=Bifidobacterium saguinibicoloris TaxID=2834433 RepID=UPI001C595D46|nr:hypothetical protein [Bifidobacterium saguinibicoloris]MBW3080044.1 hypothetical protein [Bifidobacterium saguinibicoloris]
MIAMRSHTTGTSLIVRLASEYGTLIDDFFAVARGWVAEHLAHPDEENWFAMWYPASASQIA